MAKGAPVHARFINMDNSAQYFRNVAFLIPWRRPGLEDFLYRHTLLLPPLPPRPTPTAQRTSAWALGHVQQRIPPRRPTATAVVVTAGVAVDATGGQVSVAQQRRPPGPPRRRCRWHPTVVVPGGRYPRVPRRRRGWLPRATAPITRAIDGGPHHGGGSAAPLAGAAAVRATGWGRARARCTWPPAGVRHRWGGVAAVGGCGCGRHGLLRSALPLARRRRREPPRGAPGGQAHRWERKQRSWERALALGGLWGPPDGFGGAAVRGCFLLWTRPATAGSTLFHGAHQRARGEAVTALLLTAGAAH